MNPDFKRQFSRIDHLSLKETGSYDVHLKNLMTPPSPLFKKCCRRVYLYLFGVLRRRDVVRNSIVHVIHFIQPFSHHKYPTKSPRPLILPIYHDLYHLPATCTLRWLLSLIINTQQERERFQRDVSLIRTS